MVTVIDVLNATTILSDQDVLKMVSDVHLRVAVEHPWGLTTSLKFVPRGGKLTPGNWLLLVLDDPNQPYDVPATKFGVVYARMAFGDKELEQGVLDMIETMVTT
jgi:hypothetical protein